MRELLSNQPFMLAVIMIEVLVAILIYKMWQVRKLKKSCEHVLSYGEDNEGIFCLKCGKSVL